jgi:uncharacterized protein with HEPN domain
LTSRDLGYLRDIRDAADRAIGHIGGLKAETIADSPALQDGPVRCLILMGEAAKSLSDHVREELSEIDWTGMIGMRNILVHRYQEIDYLELWTVVNRDLPPIADVLTNYLRSRS